jgi:hypothetical protein
VIVNGLSPGVHSCVRSFAKPFLSWGLVAVLAAGVAQPAWAQAPEPSPQALVAARELFREATGDVDAGNFEQALGKFRRVAAVKETAAVRYNIARCEEQLGKLGGALADYELAEREGAGDAKAADIAKMAGERAAAIRPRVPRLTIAPPNRPVTELVVRLDGDTQPRGTLGVALPVDPGTHRVEATTAGGASFTKDVTLAEGETSQVQVDFPNAPALPAPVETLPPPEPDSPNRVPGYIVLGLGGALGVTSFVFLLLHNQAASDLETQKTTDCTLVPGGLCPESARANLDPLQSSAKRNEGLAIGFGVGAAVAIGVGAYLVLKPGSSTGGAPAATKTTTPSARLVPGLGGVLVVGDF